MLSGKDINDTCIIDRTEFLKVYEYLLKTRPSDLTLARKIPTNVAPLLLPAALIIKNMLDYTGVDKIYLPHGSLSDGIIINYCYHHQNYKLNYDPDMDLINTARNIAKRYKCDKKHIEMVENLALEIFDATHKMSGLTVRDRLLLQVSAILHEVGKFVHATGHNDAAYNLIEYTDLIGLNKDELDIVALVVKLYPKENPYENELYKIQSSSKKVSVSKLTSILRLADAMDSSHRQKIVKTTLSTSSDELHISCVAKESMAFEEWSFEHRSALFEEIIGIKPVLRVRREQEMAVKNVKNTKDNKGSKDTKKKQTTKAAKATKVTKTAKVVKATKAVKTTKPVKATKTVKAEKSVKK